MHAPPLPGVSGVCPECFLAEIEQAIAEEHPEMKRGDVFELVEEWLRAVNEKVPSGDARPDVAHDY